MGINIFCFHFAGGSRFSYHMYNAVAPAGLNIVPVELPGRGDRIQEPLLTDVHLMVEDMFQQIKQQLHTPYAIYGHSLGALLAYLVSARIMQEGLNNPIHLFVSGRSAPSTIRTSTTLVSSLPHTEFIDRLKEYGGFPEDLLADEHIMRFFGPILRSDFRGVENYSYQGPAALQVPITVMIGQEDKTTYENACTWALETSGKVTVKVFPGKHFFIYDHPKEIVQTITTALYTSYISNSSQSSV
ncbi:thioesterase II family protein [Chitinophaga flava]|uniref:Thioesterase domain-containing protein n=1 Tax=Chitinophaga flava TaxID=2259036 RepID=A0A365XV86_9BACT|nr:alpha/beta fold hydrolase [Chitinophaga flava]RBL90276.1 hypothetical protein DF182_27820 [Chitinophaga flava]